VSARARLLGLLLLACAALGTLAPAGATAQTGPLAFSSCSQKQLVFPAAGVQCGTLTVPFDRADPALGEIALAVQRVPASAQRVGVLVLLAGGPGQPALPILEEFLAPLAREPALRGYELVALDQRGTGQSQGVQCLQAAGSLKGGLPQYLGACGAALGPTRAFYSSQESVEDVDALRAALGGTPLSLFAVSYGGRVAGMYAREHPQGVARMVLDSPVPLTGTDVLDRERLRALPRVLDEGICGAGACRSFSGNVYGDLTRVVARLHGHPLRTKIYNAHGRLRSTSVTESELFDLLLALDVDPGVRELAPAAISAAAHGDAAQLARLAHSLREEAPTSGLTTPLASLAVEAPESDSQISLGLLAATYCAETELPWSSASAPAGRPAALQSFLASLPAGATAPFAPTTIASISGLAICEDWPATPPAPPAPTGISATPTLLVSGDDDLRTPYEQDLTIAAGYSDLQLLRVPGVGHSAVSTDLTGCALRAMIGFLTGGAVPASCAASGEPQALPLPPASLSRVRPLRGDRPLVGRVAAAVALTLEDFYGQVGSSGGGLRGGYWALANSNVRLHDFTDVQGVEISGSITAKGVGHFTVAGRLRGTLEQKGLTVTGHLGGARVHLHLVVT